MNRLGWVPLAAMCAAIAIPCANAQTVKVNWRQQAPFADYKTYSWVSPKGQESGFYGQFVGPNVDEQLQKHGLTKTPQAQPHDLDVAYNFVTQEVMDSTTTSDGFGWDGGGWGGGWGYWGGWGGWGLDMGPEFSTTEARPRTMGILTVDLVDDKHKQLVWRGQATEDSVSNSQKGDENQVKKSVEKMFDHFPPKQK